MGFLYSMLYLFLVSLVCFFVGRLYPKRWILAERFPFSSFSFEREGEIYQKIGVARWKTRLPDMSMLLGDLFPSFIPKKRVDNAEKIPVLIKETCIAEATHIIAAVLGVGCVFIWRGIGGKIMAVLYFLGNLPFVIIQRYNRPRLVRVHNMMCKREKQTDEV